MRLALALDEYVATDVALAIRFESRPIVLQDVEALLAFTKAILSAVEEEVLLQTGQEIEFLPEVTVTKGSFMLNLKLKGSTWNLDLKIKISEIFLGAVLFALPASAGQPPKPSAPAPSEQCVEMIGAAVHTASETWEYFGKGFDADIEVTCGTARAKYTIKNPPRKH